MAIFSRAILYSSYVADIQVQLSLRQGCGHWLVIFESEDHLRHLDVFFEDHTCPCVPIQ